MQFRHIDSYLADNFPLHRFAGSYKRAESLPPPSPGATADYADLLTRQETRNRVIMKYMAVDALRDPLTEVSDAVANVSELVDARLLELGERPSDEPMPMAGQAVE